MRATALEGLEDTVRRVDRELSDKERVREQLIALSRELVRQCAEAIRDLRDRGQSERLLRQARDGAFRIRKLSQKYPELYNSGTVENALQELAEANILASVVSERRMPLPEAMGVTPAAFLLGLGDAIGELRRMVQDALRKGNLVEAEETLAVMEGLFNALNLFDYPDAIVAVKHKQDVARSLIEKTRGEVAVSVRGRELEQKIAALEKVLARHGRQPPRPR